MALIPLPPPPPRHPAKRLAQMGVALLFLIVIALLAGEPLAEVNDQRQHPVPGRAVKVGEGTLHLFAAGQSTSLPTIVLDGDLGMPGAAWSEFIKELSKKTLVVVWDRPGYGWSTFGSGGHDGLSLVHQLHAALKSRDAIGPYVQSQELPGPYILVGQGLGAVHMRIFAAEYPDEVVGLVLLDGLYADTPLDPLKAQKDQLSGEVWKRRLLVRRLSPQDPPAWTQALAGDEREGVLAMLARSDVPRAEAAEIDALDQTVQQAERIQSLGSKPLKVLTTDRKGDPSLEGRLKQDRTLAQLSTNGDHQVVPPGPTFQARNEIGQPSPLLQAILQTLGTP